jgi:hypothetical protein
MQSKVAESQLSPVQQVRLPFLRQDWTADGYATEKPERTVQAERATREFVFSWQEYLTNCRSFAGIL